MAAVAAAVHVATSLAVSTTSDECGPGLWCCRQSFEPDLFSWAPPGPGCLTILVDLKLKEGAAKKKKV